MIAGDDPRPLLVLRECLVCNGTDEALLKGGIDNEKTFLFSTWFHCVKLPADVMEENHPFHNLFQNEDAPEHLFVSSIDGSNHDPLESQTSRTELWKSMSSLLAAEYKQKPETAIKKIGRVLDKLDAVDERWNTLIARQEEIMEEDGPGSKKLKKLNRQISEIELDRKELLQTVDDAAALELRERAHQDADDKQTDKPNAK